MGREIESCQAMYVHSVAALEKGTLNNPVLEKLLLI
jgi:hypothetical protein